MQAIHTTESYSEIRKEILTLISTLTGINIESFWLRGRSQTRQTTYYVVPVIESVSLEPESRGMVA